MHFGHAFKVRSHKFVKEISKIYQHVKHDQAEGINKHCACQQDNSIDNTKINALKMT